jgi:hypothetical protein
VSQVLVELHAAEEPAWIMGRLVKGTGVVTYR